VRVSHGARRLAIDDQYLGAVGGTTRWQSPGYDHATDRYDMAVAGALTPSPSALADDTSGAHG